MQTFLSDRGRPKHIANTLIGIAVPFITRGSVMLRKRRTALNAAGRKVVGRQKPVGCLPSGRPFPVPCSAAMASPRSYLTTASSLDGSDVRPWIGATGRLPRATGTDRAGLEPRVALIPHPMTEGACSDRAYGSSGQRQPRQGRQRSKDAPGDEANGSRGDVFLVEDGFGGTARDSAEGVPCRPPAMGDEGTHDIPRGSGADFTGPGVLFEMSNGCGNR
jgi:hypothetical protein